MYFVIIYITKKQLVQDEKNFNPTDFDIESGIRTSDGEGYNYYRGLINKLKKLIEYNAPCKMVNVYVWTGIPSRYTYCNLAIWTQSETSVSFV